MKWVWGIVFFFVASMKADGLDDALATLNGLKAQMGGQLGQINAGLSNLSRDVSAVVTQMSSEKTASVQMKERIDSARKELASAEASIAAIKAMPEMIETPLKQSFERSRELFARLEKVATTRAALADQIAADGATVVARSQESQKNISSLVQLLNALIAEGERVLGGLIKIRNVFVRR